MIGGTARPVCLFPATMMQSRTDGKCVAQGFLAPGFGGEWELYVSAAMDAPLVVDVDKRERLQPFAGERRTPRIMVYEGVKNSENHRGQLLLCPLIITSSSK